MTTMHWGIIAALLFIAAGYGVVKSDIYEDVLGGGGEAAPLVNTYWKLTELNGEDFTMPQGMKKEPHFILQPTENRMAGFGGCNRISGSYITVGKKLNFPDRLAMTRMACPVGMDTEQAFAQALQETTGWHIRGTTLELRNKDGETVGVFEQTLTQ